MSTDKQPQRFQGTLPEKDPGAWCRLLENYVFVDNGTQYSSILAALCTQEDEKTIREVGSLCHLSAQLPMSTVVDFLWYYNWFGRKEWQKQGDEECRVLSAMPMGELTAFVRREATVGTLPLHFTQASLLFNLFFGQVVPVQAVTKGRSEEIESYSPRLAINLARHLYGYQDDYPEQSGVPYYNFLQYVPQQRGIERIIYLALDRDLRNEMASRYELYADSNHLMTDEYFISELIASREAILFGECLLPPFTVRELENMRPDIARRALNRYTTVKLVRAYNINTIDLNWSGREDLLTKIVRMYCR